MYPMGMCGRRRLTPAIQRGARQEIPWRATPTAYAQRLMEDPLITPPPGL